MEFKRSEKVKIVTGVSEFNGEVAYDIRTHVLYNKGENAGKFGPTAKGVRIPLDKAEKFLTHALREVREALEEQAKPKARKKVVKK